ncbi:MAG: SHOCT domain-containing protein [Halobacteriota archaeon]
MAFLTRRCRNCGTPLDEQIGTCKECDVLLTVSQWWWYGLISLGLSSIDATKRALILHRPILFGLLKDVTELPYAQINSIKKNRGFLNTLTATVALHISTGTHGSFVIDGLFKENADKIIGIVHQHQDAASSSSYTPVPAQQPTVTGINVADELKKLAELKSEGILTDEEFAEQKKKLLRAQTANQSQPRFDLQKGRRL